MSERAFRLAIWSAVIQIVRALGRYWGFADDVKIIQPRRGECAPVDPDGMSLDVTVTGITGYK